MRRERRLMKSVKVVMERVIDISKTTSVSAPPAFSPLLPPPHLSASLAIIPVSLAPSILSFFFLFFLFFFFFIFSYFFFFSLSFLSSYSFLFYLLFLLILLHLFFPSVPPSPPALPVTPLKSYPKAPANVLPDI